MSAPRNVHPRRDAYTAEVVAHIAVGLAIVAAIAAYFASPDGFGVESVMTVALGGLVVSGAAAWCSGPKVSA